MTTSGTGPRPPEPPHGFPFAALAHEVQELGFEPVPDLSPPEHTTYRATDSRVAIRIVHTPDERGVWLAVGSGPDLEWALHFTAGTPHAVQLIALYAVLNDNPAAALDAAAAAIGLSTSGSPAQPSPPAG
jgi:hypothetical protein